MENELRLGQNFIHSIYFLQKMSSYNFSNPAANYMQKWVRSHHFISFMLSPENDRRHPNIWKSYALSRQQESY